MPLIAPSILSADFTQLGQEIKAVESGGADWIHVDVMDGHFVPNITMGPLVVEAVRRSTALPVDVHLMIENPDRYIEAFAKAGSDYISVQVETCPHLHRTIHSIKEAGAKAGAVLNPATPLTCLDWVLADLDFVLIMSVNPGFGGQKFIPASLEKIRDLRIRIDKNGLNTLIQIDGGINSRTVAQVVHAGADVLVAGSAIFGSGDYRSAIAQLKSPRTEKNR
ncbi:MAG: ribulose-phosphate 3-epimerase [Desulfobacteraceae bacterium]|nr:MAG: ribulose-phosphate 3-epimerase [Desulfobacteraceae bacterium]